MCAIALSSVCVVVPTAPRDLRLSLTQADPPIVLVEWTRPAQSHGPLGGFKLTYGVTGQSYVEERRLHADKNSFTTGFLGIIHRVNTPTRAALRRPPPRTSVGSVQCNRFCALVTALN